MIDITLDNISFLVESKKEFKDAWTENMLISGIKTGNLQGIIYNDEEIQKGYITYSIAVDSADVEDVFVSPQYRRSGIAKALIQEMLNRLEKLNIKKVFLEVRESKIKAINLYESFGFTKISVRKKYYSDGEDGLIYVKEN